MPTRALTAADAVLFEQILEIAADAIVTIDETQDIVHFNRGAEQMFGYAAAEVLGTPLNRLLPERFRAAHPAYVSGFGHSAETARLMGHRREVYGLRKNGAEFPAEASILKIQRADGRFLYTALVRDVTERKVGEQRQRYLADVSATLAGSLDYESTLASLIRLQVPVLADACVIDVVQESGALRRIAYAPAESPMAAPLATLAAHHAPTWDSPAVVIDVLRTREPALVAEVTDDWLEAHTDTPEEAELRRATGVRSLLIVPLVARDQVLGALTLMRATGERYVEGDIPLAIDVASRAALALDNARLYRDARHATQARDEVLGIVSHDLRNPLSAIAMCSKALLDGAAAEPDPTRRELATAINESAGWMSRLIQDLLDVSTIEAGRLSVECGIEDVRGILERVVSMFVRMAAERGIELTVAVDDDVPEIRADGERLIQAIANLVGNAAKFTARGGAIRLCARTRGADVEIDVEDTGAGIAADELPYVFERYWHKARGGSERGSGLGLAIAKGIVEAHGGRIDVRSTVGVGTVFTIIVPREGTCA